MVAWLIIAALAAASCLFAACNYALRTFNHIRMEEELARRQRAGMMKPMLDRLGRLILTAATIRILFNILVILVLAWALEGWASQHWAIHLAAVGLVAFVIILVFSVAIPNAWAKYSGERLLAGMLPTLRGMLVLFSPITAVMHQIDEFVRRLIGAPRVDEDIEHVDRQIMSVVTEGEREGVVDPQEKQMIESVLEFQDTRADQIMTPRTEIIAVDADSELASVLDTIHRAGHSRIPVFEGSLDNIVGLLYAKDLLWELAQAQARQSAGQSAGVINIRKVMRPPLFVPESRPVSELLNDLRRTKVHLAVVLDEFGGTAGLVTIEDILEEIVGEIADEHEQPEPSMIRRIDEHAWDIDGRAHVDDVNSQLKLALPEDDEYDTIGGFVIATLGRIPKTGDKLLHENVTITVSQAEPRRIVRLRLEVAPLPSQAGG